MSPVALSQTSAMFLTVLQEENQGWMKDLKSIYVVTSCNKYTVWDPVHANKILIGNIYFLKIDLPLLNKNAHL